MYELTWQMSHRGNLLGRLSRSNLWCLLASLFAACTATSQFAHSAASSAQHISVAGAFSHTSHCIFISVFFFSLALWERTRKEELILLEWENLRDGELTGGTNLDKVRWLVRRLKDKSLNSNKLLFSAIQRLKLLFICENG